MKRLKLQKALLAICLALPITLTTSNGINAMQPTDLQTGQKSNNNEPNETTHTADTFSQYYDEYAEAGGPPLPGTDTAHRLFLKKYLREDIIRYLALLLQANCKEITNWQYPDGKELISQGYIYNLLLDHIKQKGDDINKEQQLIIKNESNKEQLTNISNALSNIFHAQESYQTTEHEILRALFEKIDNIRNPAEVLYSLNPLISNYSDDNITTVDKPISQLINFLEPVAQQLLKEHSYITKTGGYPFLLKFLADRLIEFSEEYKQKQKNTNELLQILDATKTHKEALKEFVNYTQNKRSSQYVGEEEYKKFLLCYIGTNPWKYLALLLQANYNLISFPPDIPIAQQLNSDKIYDILTEQYFKLLDASSFCDEEEQIVKVKRIINNFIRNNTKAPEQTTHAAKAILILFMRTQQGVTTNDKITALKNEIEQYISQEHHIIGELHNPLPSILEEMATQLQNDAEAFDDKTQKEQFEQLKAIAQLVSNFIEAYNKNNQDVTEFHIDEIEEGEEIEETKLNNSTPNIEVKGIFDEYDDVNEQNTLNESMPERGILYKWDDILAENWHGNEAENSDDNISNYSQGEQGANNWEKEEIEGIEEEEEGEENELNTLKASTPKRTVIWHDNDVEGSENKISYHTIVAQEYYNWEEEEEEEIEEEEEGERSETIEQLMQEVNDHFNKNKEQETQISTTQKIINNLSATNKMLQIINLILY